MRRGKLIYSRMVAHVRAQDWSAITIELLIVIIGVFVGTQVSNWNDQRIERAETVRLLHGLQPELTSFVHDDISGYFVVARRYADTAFAGWRGDPDVSDRQFVIAAYQASQTNYSARNIGAWSQIFGGERLLQIDDKILRNELTVLMTFDIGLSEQELFTDYRQNVRKVIPEHIQDAIRGKCGDRRVGDRGGMVLPPTCTLDLPEEDFRVAARALRAQPELAGELRWHFAAVATYVENLDNLMDIARRVLRRIEHS